MESRQTDITREMQCLDKAISEMATETDFLRERLAPVMCVKPIQPEEGKEHGNVATPLAEEIRQQRLRIQYLTGVLQRMRQDIEL